MLALLVSAGLPLHWDYSGDMTRSGPMKYAAESPDQGATLQPSVYVIVGNVTVDPGNTLRFIGNSVEAYSTTARHVSITVGGSLILENSSVSIMNASGNSVVSIAINIISGGSLFLYNSSFRFNGSVTGIGSSITYENSTIATPPSGSSEWPGSARWLSQYYNDSRIQIYNSTINGLYNQTSQILFKAANAYMSDPFFARNGTIAFSPPVDNMGTDSFVTGINLSVSFFGNYNGTGGNLSIFFNGSSIATQHLLFEGNSPEVFYLHINLSADPRPVEWFGNSSNFYATLQESVDGPIEITNITAELKSNDTEAVLGEEAYGMIVDNSSMSVVNSSFGYNLEPLRIHGFPNFMSRHMSAYNSTIVLDDTGLGNDNYMGGTAFQLNDSRIFIYRSFRISPMDNGSFIRNFRFSVAPQIAMPANETQWKGQSYPQDKIDGSNLTVLSGVLSNLSYSYTGDYGLSWEGSSEMISTKPYPFITTGQKAIAIQALAPEILVNRLGSYANSTFATVNLTYSVMAIQGEVFSGNFTIVALSPAGSILNRTGFSIGNSSGTFSRQIMMGGQWSQGDIISVIFDSGQPYCIPGNSIGSVSMVYQQSNHSFSREYQIMVYSSGISGSLAWKLHAGNRSFWISGPLTSIAIQGYPSNFSATSPAGYDSSLVFRAGSGTNGTLYANFTAIEYEVSFVHESLKSNISWTLLISGKEFTTSSSIIMVNLTPGEHMFLILVPGSASSNLSHGFLNVTSNSTVFFRVWLKTAWYSGLEAYLHSLPIYIMSVASAAIAAIGIRYRRMHSWQLCRTCGISVERGVKQCQSCLKRDGGGKY